jgi:hypothetical protein
MHTPEPLQVSGVLAFVRCSFALAVRRAAGKGPPMAASFDWHRGRITRRTPITVSYRNTQNVRRFFKSQCRDHFTFDRAFMAWLDHGRCRRSMAKAWSQRY